MAFDGRKEHLHTHPHGGKNSPASPALICPESKYSSLEAHIQRAHQCHNNSYVSVTCKHMPIAIPTCLGPNDHTATRLEGLSVFNVELSVR